MKKTYAKSKLECQGGLKGKKVLGVKWNCESDTFHLDLVHIAKRAEGIESTHRNVSSLLASLFDPLGLISPVTVSMKSCPLERAFNSTVGVDISENTGPTYEDNTQCATVTAKNRWHEILAK